MFKKTKICSKNRNVCMRLAGALEVLYGAVPE
jgi:hypothetical protein